MTDYGSCAYCGKPFTMGERTVAHTGRTRVHMECEWERQNRLDPNEHEPGDLAHRAPEEAP